MITEYNPEWPQWFERIRDSLVDGLTGFYLSIEHVGSTSIPGMNAKPIIDIDVIIKKKDFHKVKDALGRKGYFHQGDLGIKGREAFDLSDEKKVLLPKHNLYVCYEGEYELRKHLAFRDYLRNNRAAREQLKDLKRELERTCATKQEYMDRKHPLVQELTIQALKEYKE